MAFPEEPYEVYRAKRDALVSAVHSIYRMLSRTMIQRIVFQPDASFKTEDADGVMREMADPFGLTYPPPVPKLSELVVDVDKDWEGKNIFNLGVGKHDLNTKLDSLDVHLAKPHVYTGDDILERLQRQLGVWWFNNNWRPVGIVAYGLGGSGAISWATLYVRISTGTTADSLAYVYKMAYGLSGGYSWGVKRYFGVYVYFATYSAQNIHIVTGMCPGKGSANTYNHVGFKVVDANLYGTVGDGEAESVLLLETLTGAVYRRLECIFDPAVPECRFYVDGVDKGTVEANLPSGTGYAPYMLRANIHNTEAVNKYFYLYEARTLQLG